MSSILKVDTIQDQAGNNIINESNNVITIGASGDTITVPAGATVSGFTSAGIDDNATSVAITIDSSERVGIGTTSPSALLHVDTSNSGVTPDSSADDLFIENSGSGGITIGSGTSGVGTIYFGDSGDNNAGRLNYYHSDNSMRMFTAGAERMRVTSDGSVAINSTTAQAKLHIVKNDAGALNDGNSNMLMIENTTATGMAIGSSNNGEGHIYFSDSDDADVGTISYFHSDNSLRFRVNAGEPMRIDSSRNLLVGKTSTDNAVAGSKFGPGGQIVATVANDDIMILNRTGSNGKILRFFKDTSEVGNIGIESAGFYIDGEANHTGLIFTSSSVSPRDNGSVTNNLTDLGNSAGRWKDLYLGGSLVIGGTGTANALNDYEEGTFTPTITTDAGGGNQGISYGDRYGSYTKVGRLVTITIFINTDSVTSFGTGNVIISPLPFASNNDSGYRSSPSIGYAKNWGQAPSGGTIANNTTLIYLRKRNSSSAIDNLSSFVDAGNQSGTQELILTATYESN